VSGHANVRKTDIERGAFRRVKVSEPDIERGVS
jgi:hypothetical protein